MNKRKKDRSNKEISWKPLLHIYRTTKIPWLMLILVVASSFGTQTFGVLAVPYTSKINTGDMAGLGFLFGYIWVSIIYSMLETGYDTFNGIGRAQMGRNVRKRLWKKMLRLPVATYEKEDPQRFVSRVTKDTEYAYGAITAMIQLISIIYGCVIAMNQIVKIYDGLSFLMVAIIPVLIVCSIFSGKIQYHMEYIINKAYSKVTNYYGEHLPNITYIKTNNMEEHEYKKGVEINNLKYKTDIKYKVLFVLQTLISSLAHYISMIVVLWLASAMVRAGEMKMAELISLYTYFELLMANATLFLGVWQAMKASHGGCAKIAEIDNSPEEDLSGINRVEGQHNIEFDHVSFRYDESREILKDVSFTIPKGKITAIVGENGSGKSTIMNLIERFEKPVSGSIKIDGNPLSTIDGISWREKLGYVSQGNQTIQGTVRENIIYGIRDNYTEEELYKAASDADAYDFIMDKDTRFDTQINIFDSEFSGGQLQRIAIARAIMKNPDYLILDEATSGVDIKMEKRILKHITKKMSGKTVIMISHNMDIVQKADHVVVIKNGEVEAEGSLEEVSRESRTFQSFQNAGCKEYVTI